MLDRIVEGLLAAVSAVPAWMVGEDSPNFLLIQTMFAVLLLVIIVYVISMKPGSLRCGALCEEHIALFQAQTMTLSQLFTQCECERPLDSRG